jgi:hypothetical protein
MIVITRGQQNDIYCTPYENAGGVVWSYYIMRFTNRSTNEFVQIAFQDLSTTLRYQKLRLANTNNFTTYSEGFWTYQIYGSALGLTPNTPILETGYMLLKNSTNFEPEEYNEQSNIFKAYNGQL